MIDVRELALRGGGGQRLKKKEEEEKEEEGAIPINGKKRKKQAISDTIRKRETVGTQKRGVITFYFWSGTGNLLGN